MNSTSASFGASLPLPFSIPPPPYYRNSPTSPTAATATTYVSTYTRWIQTHPDEVAQLEKLLRLLLAWFRSPKISYQLGKTSVNLLSFLNQLIVGSTGESFRTSSTSQSKPYQKAFTAYHVIKLVQLLVEMLVRKYLAKLRPHSVVYLIVLIEVFKAWIQLYVNWKLIRKAASQLFCNCQRRRVSSVDDDLSNHTDECLSSGRGHRSGIFIPAVRCLGTPDTVLSSLNSNPASTISTTITTTTTQDEHEELLRHKSLDQFLPDEVTAVAASAAVEEPALNLCSVVTECISVLRPVIQAISMVLAEYPATQPTQFCSTIHNRLPFLAPTLSKISPTYVPYLSSLLIDLLLTYVCYCQCSSSVSQAISLASTVPTQQPQQPQFTSAAGLRRWKEQQQLNSSQCPLLFSNVYEGDPRVSTLKKRYFELFQYLTRNPFFEDHVKSIVESWNSRFIERIPLIGSLVGSYFQYYLEMQKYHYFTSP